MTSRPRSGAAPRAAAAVAAALAGLLVFAALAPSKARAAVVEEGTRFAAEAGWRLVPNARFRELAASSGHPMQGPGAGGPEVLGVFGYRVSANLDVSIELGWASERFGFIGQPALQLTQVPVLITSRWFPLPGAVAPYLGLGYGYFLNFFSGGPLGSMESHTSGPQLLAGASFELSERFALVAEYRLGLGRASIPGLGAVQVGGNSLVVGAEFSFEPEKNRLE